MSLRACCLTLFAALLAVPAVFAQQPAAPADAKPAAKMEAPKPAAEMAQVAFFNGDWSCEGMMPASPMGPGGKTTTTVKSRADLGGFWQSGTVKSTGGGMPGSMEGMFRMTWDPGAKQYVMLWADSMGGYAQSTSKGWNGDTIAFEGESHMGGQAMMGRDSFTKMADGSMKHSMEMQMAGKWTPSGDETCKHPAAKAAAPAKK